MYDDRLDAAEELASTLQTGGIGGDLVLTIPRGGVPLGNIVADELGLPLDVVVARKVGAPENPDFALGAVAPDGTTWFIEEIVDQLEVDEEYFQNLDDGVLDEAIERERRNAAEKLQRYRDGTPPEVADEDVIIVDDGAATGATARVCVQRVRELGANSIVFAIPVGSPVAVDLLADHTDELICPKVPSDFRAVFDYYREFEQITDEEAFEYLE